MTSSFEPIFSATVAWVMHVAHQDGGGAPVKSYDTFFWMSSEMVGVAALVTAALSVNARAGSGGESHEATATLTVLGPVHKGGRALDNHAGTINSATRRP